jgi:isoquinoline 1-oxidoreductase beta subunit
VAEVSVGPAGVRVDRIVAALDVGTIVNPSGLAAQVEGAALDGVATVLKWGVTVQRGACARATFTNTSCSGIARHRESRCT